MKNRTTASATALIAAAALALTGCSSGGGKVSDETPSGTNAPSSTSEEVDEDLLAASEDEEFLGDTEDVGPGITTPAAFGQTVTFSSGLSVTVSKPQSYTPGPDAYVEGNYASYVKFDVKVVNKTGAPYDPSMIFINAQSGNTEAESVYDEGLDGELVTTMLDGREGSFTTAFGVDDPDDIVLEVDMFDDFDSYALYASEAE